MVVALFELLVDPDELNAITRWLHPENAQKVGLIISIRKRAPLAYYSAIKLDKYGTKILDDLTERELNQLLYTVKNRREKMAA